MPSNFQSKVLALQILHGHVIQTITRSYSGCTLPLLKERKTLPVWEHTRRKLEEINALLYMPLRWAR